MFEPIPFEIRKRAIAAAQGRAPFDLLLRGARIADLATMEIRDADIGIVGPMIASVHAPGAFSEAKATQDLAGLIIVPGFIDGHVHVE
ncbi:MAG: adenine deaminase, partial [Pseudorhodoplanes sp.]